MNHTTLAIDTCFSNGSLSLWQDGSEVSSCIMKDSKHHSKDLITSINILLIKNDIKIGEIDKILFTNGPGSYTGIRVGISTVLGLVRSIGCKVTSVSAFNAISMKVGSKKNIIVGTSIGRDEVIYQEIDNSQIGLNNNYSIVSSTKSFKDYLYTQQDHHFVLDRNVFQRIGFELPTQHKNLTIVDASDNVSKLAYLFLTKNKTLDSNDTFLPLYGREFN